MPRRRTNLRRPSKMGTVRVLYLQRRARLGCLSKSKLETNEDHAQYLRRLPEVIWHASAMQLLDDWPTMKSGGPGVCYVLQPRSRQSRGINLQMQEEAWKKTA